MTLRCSSSGAEERRRTFSTQIYLLPRFKMPWKGKIFVEMASPKYKALEGLHLKEVVQHQWMLPHQF